MSRRKFDWEKTANHRRVDQRNLRSPVAHTFTPDDAFWKQWTANKVKLKRLGYNVVQASEGSWSVVYRQHRDKKTKVEAKQW